MLRTSFPIALAALPYMGTAQCIVQPGTALTVLPGTSVRVGSGLTFAVPAGAQVANDGVIELAPTAVISEALGSPIGGSGTERIQRSYAAPLAADEPGGLGLEVTTVVAPGLLTLERGHSPITEPGGGVGTARWFRWSAAVNSGLDATVRFAYDPVQLNGVAETDQVLHILQPNTYWLAIPSAVDDPGNAVEANGLDSLGTLTTFGGALTTGITERLNTDGALLLPTLADVQVTLIALAADKDRAVDLMDAEGRCVRSLRLAAGMQRCTVDLAGLAQGAYAIRFDGRVLRFVKA